MMGQYEGDDEELVLSGEKPAEKEDKEDPAE